MDHHDTTQFGPSAPDEAQQDFSGPSAEAKAAPAYPSRFGRGWIPLSRDIGMPGEGAVGSSPGPCVAEDLAAYHFTPPRRAAFLHRLAEDGNVRRACAGVGVSPQAAYLARRRDAAFRDGWTAALVLGRAHVEQVLATQAVEGIREAVWYRGELVGERVRYDARLLLAHLARLDARAGDAAAEAHAARFDEILAVVAGARFPAAMADRDEGRAHAADPHLPMDRARYVAAAGCPDEAEDDCEDDYEDCDEEDADDDADGARQAARDAAEAQWDAWEGRVVILGDALAAGLLPEVDADLGEDEEVLDESGDEPGGACAQPRPLRRARAEGPIYPEHRRRSAPPPPVGEDLGAVVPGAEVATAGEPSLPQEAEPAVMPEAAEEAPEFLPRTVCIPSTSPDAADEAGDVAPETETETEPETVFETHRPWHPAVQARPEWDGEPSGRRSGHTSFGVPDDGRCAPFYGRAW